MRPTARIALLFSLAAGAAGCAAGRAELSRSKPELIISADGRTPGLAQRRALQEALELYLSTAAIARSSGLLEKGVLSRPGDYFGRLKIMETSEDGTRLEAGLDHARLLRDLRGLASWEREQSPQGPGALVAISGPAAPAVEGALRRVLLKHGYRVLDSTPAEVVIRGEAETSSLTAAGGLKAFKARLSIAVSTGGSAAGALSITQEATAVDLSSSSAQAKALENAGLLIGEKVASAFSPDFKTQPEMDVVIAAAGQGFLEIKRLILDIRAIAPAASVHLADAPPPAWRLSVRSSWKAADLARALVESKTQALRLRFIEEDRIELELVRRSPGVRGAR